jgi:serine protease Do
MAGKRLTRRRFLAAAGLTAALAGCNTPPQSDAGQDPGSDSNPTDGSAAETPVDSSAFTEVYEETIDSVVLVRTFDESGRSGQGSGFVYDSQHIVTNEHVVGGTSAIEVRFTDGTWHDATVVGTDVYSDLAVLRVTSIPDIAAPLELVDGEVTVGQRVLAIGNPFGLSGSASAGIVSGVNRTLPAANNFSIPDAIQTDAAVNPGNSGGPLVTLDGRVAGVINSGSGDNIGFAISAPLMSRVVPALVQDGEYEHSYMGVRLTDVTPLIAEANDLETARGVYIDEVVQGTPSDGVLEGSTGDTQVNDVTVPTGGDVIVRMGESDIFSRQALSTYLALETSPEETIPVEVIRDGERTTVQLTLGSRPDP